MKTILITLLLFLSYSAFAKNNDPLQQILDRLDGIENRLKKLETTSNKPQLSTPLATNTAPLINKTATKTKKTTSKPSTITKPPKAKYKEGLIVELKPVRNDQELKMPTMDSIDAFIWNPENTINEKLIQKKKINLIGTVGFEIRGYLRIKKEGIYTIKIDQKIKDVDMFDNFFIRGWLEGNIFMTTNGKSRTNKNGEYIAVASSQLEPGIYKLRLWIGYKNDENKNKMERIKLQIKKPGDLKFSSIENMVYHKIK